MPCPLVINNQSQTLVTRIGSALICFYKHVKLMTRLQDAIFLPMWVNLTNWNSPLQSVVQATSVTYF